jgi:hypothetical protein
MHVIIACDRVLVIYSTEWRQNKAIVFIDSMANQIQPPDPGVITV